MIGETCPATPPPNGGTLRTPAGPVRRRRRLAAARAVALLLLAPWVPVRGTAEGAVLPLAGEWDFAYTPASAAEVPQRPPPAAFDATIVVPGAWDDQLDRFANAGWWPSAQFHRAIPPVQYLSGTGWHRRTLDVPNTWRGRAVRLTIGWAVGVTHVWLNGEHVGHYEYGVYTPFQLDLTQDLRFGEENEVLISVDNTKGFAGGWAFLGNAGKASGITRPVTLEVSDGAGRIESTYVRPGGSLSEVAWEVELRVPAGQRRAVASALLWEVAETPAGPAMARGPVDVPSFSRARTVSWKASVSGVEPWSDRRPNLYWTRLRWVVDREVWDERTQRFGLRRFSHQGRRLLLNGSPVYLRGEFGAYYFPVHGTTPTSKEYWLGHLRRAREIGMNYLNFAARVAPSELLEAADEVGVIVQCGDHMTVLKEYRDKYADVWTPIVRWTRPYPSMCFYGFGGERNYYEGIIDQYQKQHDLIKSLHPDCLVMPQQAIRGIDYAFDEQGGKELTTEPFPHHAERLRTYTDACDLFGHYSGGAFGYTYFHTAWREMEKRFTIYERPLVAHELYMGASYLDPDNAGNYTGRVPPYLYAKLRKDLENAGVLDRWATYHENSGRLQAITKKYCVEKTRKCDGLSGYEFLGMYDMHFMPHYTTGILDEFLQLKPGDSLEGVRRYNNESVLLLDFGEHSLNRCYWAGDSFEAELMASLFGEEPLRRGLLRWSLWNGDEEVTGGRHEIRDLANGRVTTLRRLALTWPRVDETTRLNLRVELRGAGYELRNDWDFWVFPRGKAPDVAAAADAKCLALLSARYGRLAALETDSRAKLRIVSRVGSQEIDYLAAGGDLLLLGAKPFPVHGAWRSFRPGLGGRLHHNVGTVIAQHPVFASLPHEGWGDWPFCPLLEGAPCVVFDDDLETAFDPILEIISSAGDVRRQAAVFEKRVERGRLLVSTCAYDESNPACVAFMDAVLRYVQGDEFQPGSELSLDLLRDLGAPRPPRDPRNELQCPGFERHGNVSANWAKYGADYEIDSTVAHGGKRSLKLTITSADRKNDARHHTGARAQKVGFARSPSALRLSTWHKTKDLTGKGERDFLLFVYISYRDGGRHTLRLFLPQGTHDWQYSETTWQPDRPVRDATLYVGMIRKTGTAWIDDVYFGEAPGVGADDTQPGKLWHNRATTAAFEADVWYLVNQGEWKKGAEVEVAREGINRVFIKRAEDGDVKDVREIRIDLTPPAIALSTEPPMEQRGGVYFATTDTRFTLVASDALSGVESLEVATDGTTFRPYTGPLTLPAGSHDLRFRVRDRAGNESVTVQGDHVTGGATDRLRVTVR